MTCALELNGVSFAYDGAPLLRDVSMCVEPGQLVAVIGANGSGKTTLIRLGLGLVRPTAGSVRLFGQPVGAFDDWGRVGYVPQRAAADPTVPLSVEETVMTGLAGRVGLFRRPTRAQRDRVTRVMQLLEVEHLRRRTIATLSGGQQQRVLIARALVTEPQLLVLDEPTTGVDVGGRDILRAALRQLVDEDVAVVYISHDPEGFAGLARRIVEVRDRQVVDCTDPWAHRHAHAPGTAPDAAPDAAPGGGVAHAQPSGDPRRRA